MLVKKYKTKGFIESPSYAWLTREQIGIKGIKVNKEVTTFSLVREHCYLFTVFAFDHYIEQYLNPLYKPCCWYIFADSRVSYFTTWTNHFNRCLQGFAKTIDVMYLEA